MANNTALANLPSTGNTIASYLGADAVRKSIEKVVTEKNVDRFVTSIVSAVQANPALSRCTNQSILSAALQGEALQLPPSPQLGYYYMVGYKNNKTINGQKVEVEEATFQMGWKGLVQLAIRSGQYKNIVVNAIKDGEIDWNPITEEFTLSPIKDPATRTKAKTIGYYAAFELVSGFKKQMFSPIEEIEAHARKYSKSYRYDLSSGKKSSIWSTNFDAMAKKTMIRQLLGKWGIMSVEMAQAYTNDMSVIDENGTARYVDNPATIDAQVQEDIQTNANSEAFEDVVDVEPEEVKPAPKAEPTPQPTPAPETTPEPKPTRGRAKKTAEPQPEPTPAPTPQLEPAPMPMPEAPIATDTDEMEPFPTW